MSISFRPGFHRDVPQICEEFVGVDAALRGLSISFRPGFHRDVPQICEEFVDVPTRLESGLKTAKKVG